MGNKKELQGKLKQNNPTGGEKRQVQPQQREWDLGNGHS